MVYSKDQLIEYRALTVRCPFFSSPNLADAYFHSAFNIWKERKRERRKKGDLVINLIRIIHTSTAHSKDQAKVDVFSRHRSNWTVFFSSPDNGLSSRMDQNHTLNSQTTTIAVPVPSYDNSGAVIYIVAVLLWYSIGIIFMLGMQMRARSEAFEETARRRTKLLIRSLRDDTNTKEILGERASSSSLTLTHFVLSEELVDKQKRARLWEIYLGNATDSKDRLNRAETVRIRHIEKQLANINRSRRMTNETLFPSRSEIEYYRSSSEYRPMPPPSVSSDEPVGLRRRSSFDQQTLERWKALANQSKTPEQLAWTARKSMLQRYFRRNPKKPLQSISQSSSTTADNLLSFTHDITMLTRRQSDEGRESFPTSDDRQNPYLTYFYAPMDDRPSILTSEFFSVTSDHSIGEK